MSRMKAVFAALVVAAMVAVVPAHAAVVKVVIGSGSSAMWQTIGLGAFNWIPGQGNNNQGACPLKLFKGKPAAKAFTPPCFHYTTKGNFNLTDTRPTKLKVKPKAKAAVDTGAMWLVWDSSAGPNIIAYIKVDSVVGNRCFFANPACAIGAPAAYNWAVNGQDISAALWGNDSTPPVAVQNLFNAAAGVAVNAAATDIRPEDAAFAECRINSLLGAGAIAGNGGDGLDGLGYNAVNGPGLCPAFPAPLAALEGTKIASGYPPALPVATTTDYANVLAFNIAGTDPFTNLAVPAYTTISVGADPIVFVYSRNEGAGVGFDGLAAVAPAVATSANLQKLFSGTNCDANNVFGINAAGDAVDAYLREPLSGTYNTTEATVMRRPAEFPAGAAIGLSMETGVGGVANDPLVNLPCGGAGARSRAIGTGEEVKSVLNSVLNNAVDGMGFTFFSYGNVGSIASLPGYGYVPVDGVDPIFACNTGVACVVATRKCRINCDETMSPPYRLSNGC